MAAMRALVWLSLGTCLAADSAVAQTLTFARDDYAAFAGARAIVTADFDRDGWPDVALANAGRNTVTVLRNGGTTGGFTVLRDTDVGAGPFAIVSGDLDRNGVPDLVVTTPDANAIEILYGRADGTLRSRVTLTDTGASRGVTLADVTRDGWLDLVYTDYDRNAVIIRPGSRTGFGAALPPITVGLRPQDVVAADFNRDGFVDLAVANTGLARLTILYGQAGAAFTRTDVGAPAGLNVLAVADLNDDGWLDLAAASSSANRIALYRGGAAGFSVSSIEAGASPRGLAIGDVNRDGRPDLLAANRNSSTVTLWLGVRGSALAFRRFGELPAGAGSRAVTVADFDNDGRLDFATANEYAAHLTAYANTTAFARGAFAFQPQPLPFGGSAIADFNHNGQWDLVSQDAVLLDGVTRVNLPPRVLTDSQTRAVAVGDLNRDGNEDIVMSEALYYGADGGHLEVLLGDGRGGFVRDGAYEGLSQARQIAIVDLNRDGWPEIVVGGYNHSTGSGVVTILTPQSAGTFIAQQTAVPGWITALQVADVDRDGKLDLVLSFESPREIDVLRGDGAGGFSSTLQIPQEKVPYALALADVNLDGWLDIITDDGPTVGVRLATGTLTWGPGVAYPIVLRRGETDWPAPPTGVLAADLTHDGVPDVLIPSMAILPGRADGTLGPSEEFSAWGASLAVDWNHDGLLDLIADATVLLNRGAQPNARPVARITTDIVDHTVTYPGQFGFALDEPTPVLRAETSDDADFHALECEWQDAAGKTLGYGPYYTIGTPEPLAPGSYTLQLIARDGRGGEGRASYAVTITPVKEVVLWPGTWGDQISPGRWQSVEDSTAAGGRRLWYPNANAAKVQSPSAAATAYFDYYFTADPTQIYKLWIRGKAQNDSPYNDSVWVQFSGAATVSGQPAYRIGTTSGLAVNLEECSGCGLSGWGWEDDGWGARNRNGVFLRFPQGGPQTIRLQIREDGFSIDQIVLSSEKYLTARPGAAKNDTTIFRETQHYTGWN
jgi:VCBS repeat protein